MTTHFPAWVNPSANQLFSGAYAGNSCGVIRQIFQINATNRPALR